MDKQAAILASFLQLKSSLTTKQLLRAIGDWFKVMDYQKWNNMWPNTNTINVQEDLLRHRSWFTDSRIRATPTLFINSKKMPGRYSISDFKLLIPSLATLITETKNNLVVK